MSDVMPLGQLPELRWGRPWTAENVSAAAFFDVRRDRRTLLFKSALDTLPQLLPTAGSLGPMADLLAPDLTLVEPTPQSITNEHA